jgi:hypothetical protein
MESNTHTEEIASLCNAYSGMRKEMNTAVINALIISKEEYSLFLNLLQLISMKQEVLKSQLNSVIKGTVNPVG